MKMKTGENVDTSKAGEEVFSEAKSLLFKVTDWARVCVLSHRHPRPSVTFPLPRA